ncbi:DUF4837 family protein [Flavicella sediminum]|uniref:DUF4837 family protein n=1 Tax=Flavicella sediminum TaxID=2585141 RepID=UPI0011205729|nr:DUF4837 family protein [Flavicella sediminum]
MKNILLGLLTFVALVGCENKNAKPVISDSNGRMNHLLIVMDNSKWQGEVGGKLKEIIMTPVIGLPQEENQFDVSQIPSNSFGKMFRTSRNILIVEIDTLNAFQTKRDHYARPQQIVRIVGPTEEEIINTLDLYKDELIAVFKKSDIANIQDKIAKKSFAKGKYKTLTQLGVEMTIPTFFRTVEDTGEFLWLRQYLSGGIAKGDGRSNILVYSVPMENEPENILETVVQIRDSIGKKFLPGSKEGMYMITEKATKPRVYKTTLDEKNTFKTYGKWELMNDFMAGPFVSFILRDTANKRWIVLEGFTYAPSVEKRDFMFELEAILKTVKVL